MTGMSGTRVEGLMELMGWAVLHSLWQGALILLAVWTIRKWAGPRRPALAYAAGIAGLVSIFAAFLFTLVFLISSGVGNSALNNPVAATIPAATGFDLSALIAGASQGGSQFDVAGLIPWLGLAWAMGFFVLTLQGMYAFAKTRCLATMGLSPAPGTWSERFTDLARASGVSSRVEMHVSALVNGPLTLGTLKPMVLVPAGFLTGMPSDQVEAILLHELAHIRRQDFLIGLVQTVIRTTLYFNPAVIVISRWVDEDREQACDDFAVRHTGRPDVLAKGLAALRLNLATPQLAMAATGQRGALLTRLERIMGRPVKREGLGRLSAVTLAGVVVGATVLATNSYAHPHKSDTERRWYSTEDTIVIPEPPVPPAMPVFPPLPEGLVPPLPNMPIPPAFNADNYKGMNFEDAMEAWGEEMEEWGEAFEDKMDTEWEPKMEAAMEDWAEKFEDSFGEEFEERMEAWGESMEEWGEKFEESFGEDFQERMEKWGESVEARGGHLEELSKMSDAELNALGVDRDDLELAGEAFGLMIAEEVVTAMLPETLEAEARLEIQKERAELDRRRVIEAERRIERAMERSSRSAARAERDAERSLRHAERERARAAARAERESREALVNLNGGLDAADVAEGLLSKLRMSGFIDEDEESYKFYINSDYMKINGERHSHSAHDSYITYLKAQGWDCSEPLFIKKKPGYIYMELGDGESKTRITMND